MPDTLTCGTREVEAPDGVAIPIPSGGIGLPGGLVEIREDAQVSIRISTNSDGDVMGYYVVVNSLPEDNHHAAHLFTELAVETAITKLEHLAAEAIARGPHLLFKAAGLVAGVLVSLFTTSPLIREVFIRTSLDMGNETSGPPVTYCLLVQQ